MAATRTKPANRVSAFYSRNSHAAHSNGTTNRISKFITDGKTKLAINLIGNGGASAFNLITFINTISPFSDNHELLERVSEIWTKLATGSQGFITAIDQFEKKNIVPLIGNILEVPIAIFSSGRNLWLFRGISQGLSQFFRAIDQREILNKKGSPVVGSNGKPQIIGGDFKTRGWWFGLTTTMQEIPKMLFELVEKPSNIKKLTHSMTLASVVQVIGGSIALAGIEQAGALLRNIAGIGVDLSLMLDENKDNTKSNKKDFKFMGLNFSSWFTRAGVTWIGAAIGDEAKRIPGVEDAIPGLNYLAYFFDRGASVLYTIGNLKANGSTKTKRKNMYQRLQRVSSN